MIWYDIFNCNWVVSRWQQYSTHIHTNNTEKTQNKQYIQQHKNQEECGPCPVFAGFTLTFVLQLRKKDGKPSVRVAIRRKFLRVFVRIISDSFPNKFQLLQTHYNYREVRKYGTRDVNHRALKYFFENFNKTMQHKMYGQVVLNMRTRTAAYSDGLHGKTDRKAKYR